MKPEEIKQMISDGDTGVPDGRISFEEFVTLARTHNQLSSAKLWAHLRNDAQLQKGAMVAINRYEELKQKTSSLKSSSNKTKPVTEVSAEDKARIEIEEKRDKEEEKALELLEMKQDRIDAIRNASISVSLLTLVAIYRRVILRI